MSDVRFAFLEGTGGKEFVCNPDAYKFGKPPKGPSSKSDAKHEAAQTLCFLRRNGTAYTRKNINACSEGIQKSPKDSDLMCFENMVR